MIRLALVDDHPTLLSGLAAIFAAEPGYQLVATGGSASDAERIAREFGPDIMLLDLSMPGDIFVSIAAMTRAFPRLKLVVFTAFANVELALRALDAGALGFVIKGGPSDDLFDAMESVLRGELYATPEFSPNLFRGVRNRRRSTGAAATLTARENQIVTSLLDAKTNREIARDLQLTDKMLGHYMSEIMKKLGVRSRTEIVATAERLRTLRPQGPG